MSAEGAKKQRALLKKLMETPGVDFGKEIAKYMSDTETFLPRAQDAAGKITQANQEQLAKSLRDTIPNYDELVKERSDVVGKYIKGEVPEGVLAIGDRATAGADLNRFGQFGGTFPDRARSALGANQSLALQQWGINALNTLPQVTPRAPVYDVSNFLGPTAAQRAQIRFGERGQNLGVGQSMATIPTSEQIYGNTLGQVGGIAMGYGLGQIGGSQGGSPQNTPLGSTYIGNPSTTSYPAWSSSPAYGTGSGNNWWGDYTKRQWGF